MSPASGTPPAELAPSPASWRERSPWFGPRLPYLVLTLIVVGAFVMRFLTLREIPYPPSSDAAGDLVWLNTYLGHPLPGYTIDQAPPPVYLFLVVYPFTTGFGTFTGIQVMMALIPALLAFPMYYLMRWSDFGEGPALVAAAVIAVTAVFSNMVSWNSAYNITGILFLVTFLALWVRLANHRSWKSLAVTGFALSLVAGTHPLTFVFALAALVVYFLLVLIQRNPGLLRHAKTTLKMAGFAALFTIPYLPFYYYTYFDLSNLGGVSAQNPTAEVVTSYSLVFAYPWGSGTWLPPVSWTGAFILVEMAVTVVALIFLWRDRRDRLLATIGLSLFIATLLLIPVDPANSIRAVYFLPIAWVPLTVAWATRWARSQYVTRTTARVWQLRSLAPRPRARRWIQVGVVLAVAAGFVFINVYISQTELKSDEVYYSLLDANSVAGLNWLRDNTPSNATVYDGANLQAWVPGYALRDSYYPNPLSVDITSTSYQRNLDANLISLGSYVLSDPYLYVATNSPSPFSSPAIYLRTQSYWDPLWSAAASATSLQLSVGNHTTTVSLYQGRQAATYGGTYPNGTAWMAQDFEFPPAGYTVNETVTLTGSVTRVAYTVTNATFESVSMYWSMPPSGYYYSYPSVPAQSFQNSFSQALGIYAGASVRMAVSGPALLGSVFTDPTGWTRLSVNSSIPSLQFTLTGWAGASGSGAPAYTDTLSLAQTLGIGYFIVSSTENYDLYSRLNSLLSYPSSGLTVVFTSGEIYIFELD